LRKESLGLGECIFNQLVINAVVLNVKESGVLSSIPHMLCDTLPSIEITVETGQIDEWDLIISRRAGWSGGRASNLRTIRSQKLDSGVCLSFSRHLC
jgi:hypothetical protein